MFKKAIQWTFGDKPDAGLIKAAISWASAKIPILGQVSSSVSVLRSMENKSELYYQAGISESQANALAAADTLPEIFVSRSLAGAGTAKSAIGKFVQWLTQSKVNSAIYKDSTNKTLNEFYSTGNNSKIMVSNPKITNPDGRTLKIYGDMDMDDLKSLQRNYGSQQNSPSSNASFKLEIEENVYYNYQTGKIERIPVNWQNYINQARDFSKLQPSKSDEITQPTVQGVSGKSSLLDQSQLIVHQPIVQAASGAGKPAWLGQLGNILRLAGQAVGAVAGIAAGAGSKPTGTSGQMSVQMGSQSFTGGSFPLKHTGGKITPQPIANTLRASKGKDEVLAILRAGETVRTEAQEQELQQEKYAEFLEAVRPYLEERESKPKSIAEAYDPDNKIPCLLNKTTQDEEIIIAIIAQAWKSNRLGFRNVLRYE